MIPDTAIYHRRLKIYVCYTPPKRFVLLGLYEVLYFEFDWFGWLVGWLVGWFEDLSRFSYILATWKQEITNL